MVLAPLSLTSGCNCQKPEQPKTEQKTELQETKNMTRKTTDSGLQYEIIKPAEANAKKPKVGDIVVVHYTGWLADANGNPLKDQKFDSSVDRNQPFEFPIGRGHVIKGWDEGVIDMQTGEKRLLIIPAPLAYGNRSMGPKIPANSTLVFEVELIDIK